MKQIVFISGKGGTGKSTVVSSLCLLINNKMISDCDVDAPNLHILLKGDLIEKSEYRGMKEAEIDISKCISCDLCRQVCRFDAITPEYEIKPMKCEGCGACVLVCPQDAIKLYDTVTGMVSVENSPEGIFAHALLEVGAEGSGKLVTQVRKVLKGYENNEDYVLIDGSPGIGCVVIASITETDGAVIVTEPTMSGKSDLERVMQLVEHFGIRPFVCINKFDLNLDITREIEDYCEKNDYQIVAKIPFDQGINEALKQFKTPVQAGNKVFTDEILKMWRIIVDTVEKDDK